MPVVKFLSKEDILRAMRMTRSNRAAARYLHVSYFHYRMYAKTYKDDTTGKSLFEMHLNPSGKGIPKYLLAKGKEPPLLGLLEGTVPAEHFDPKKIKQRLLFEGLIEEKCNRCGFSERRVLDTKVPLILSHKDGNRQNFRLENLEFLCYNCSFLYAASPISEKQAEQMEDYVDRMHEEYDWELDEHHIEHLRSLNLWDKKETPGEEYISKL